MGEDGVIKLGHSNPNNFYLHDVKVLRIHNTRYLDVITSSFVARLLSDPVLFSDCFCILSLP